MEQLKRPTLTHPLTKTQETPAHTALVPSTDQNSSRKSCSGIILSGVESVSMYLAVHGQSSVIASESPTRKRKLTDIEDLERLVSPLEPRKQVQFACTFCRERKIACGRSPAGNIDATCMYVGFQIFTLLFIPYVIWFPTGSACVVL